jgi:hypothetical protein
VQPQLVQPRLDKWWCSQEELVQLRGLEDLTQPGGAGAGVYLVFFKELNQSNLLQYNYLQYLSLIQVVVQPLVRVMSVVAWQWATARCSNLSKHQRSVSALGNMLMVHIVRAKQVLCRFNFND